MENDRMCQSETPRPSDITARSGAGCADSASIREPVLDPLASPARRPRDAARSGRVYLSSILLVVLVLMALGFWFRRRVFGLEKQIAGITFCWCEPGTLILNPPVVANGADSQIIDVADGFWLAKHEVTQSQWEQIMGTKPWEGQVFVNQGKTYPAVCISWEDAQAFCAKVTASERAAGRLPVDWAIELPTEIQWEYAARAGSPRPYISGDTPDPLPAFAWYAKKATEAQAPVGKQQANSWFLHDMAGNVWEWCADEFRAGENRGVRAVRGGGWLDEPAACRFDHRWGQPTKYRCFDLGFRVALVKQSKQ